MHKLLVVLLVTLSGCATTEQRTITYHRDGATAEQKTADLAVCKYEAAKSKPNFGPTLWAVLGPEAERVINDQKLIGLCLESKGYTLSRQP